MINQLIDHLAWAGGWFLAAEAKAASRQLVLDAVHCGWLATFNCERRDKRHKSPAPVAARRTLPIEAVLLRRSGDKRDDLSAYEARIGKRPVCHPAPVLSSVGWPRAGGGVVFPKLSKLLNQEDALSAPC